MATQPSSLPLRFDLVPLFLGSNGWIVYGIGPDPVMGSFVVWSVISMGVFVIDVERSQWY